MLIAQLTDTHIKAGGKLAYRKIDASAYLDTAIQHLNRFSPRIEAVIITGDLTDAGSEAEFIQLKRHLDHLTMPVYLIPGNHDRRDSLRHVFAEVDYLPPAPDFIQYSLDHFPIRLIGLDSLVEGKPYGFLCDTRLDWLRQTLRAQPDKPTLLFIHHPPFDTGIHHMDVQNLQNADALFALLQDFPQVRHIACGHVHRACDAIRQNIALSIAPTAAHAVSLDLDPTAPPSFTMDPPAVRLFRLTEHGDIMSHLSYIGQFDGPYPFFDASGKLID